MDIASFLFGTGIALFIALLAWGNQISKPREDVLILEEKYIRYIKRKKKQVLPLLRNPSKYKATQVIKALIGFVGDSKTGEEELQLAEDIKKLHGIKKSLEAHFAYRYSAVIALTLISFFLGYLSILYGKNLLTINLIDCIFSISFDAICISVFFIIVLLIVRDLIVTIGLEKRFVEALHNALDRIEG
jgi:hypothetical protein